MAGFFVTHADGGRSGVWHARETECDTARLVRVTVGGNNQRGKNCTCRDQQALSEHFTHFLRSRFGLGLTVGHEKLWAGRLNLSLTPESQVNQRLRTRLAQPRDAGCKRLERLDLFYSGVLVMLTSNTSTIRPLGSNIIMLRDRREPETLGPNNISTPLALARLAISSILATRCG